VFLAEGLCYKYWEALEVGRRSSSSQQFTRKPRDKLQLLPKKKKSKLMLRALSADPEGWSSLCSIRSSISNDTLPSDYKKSLFNPIPKPGSADSPHFLPDYLAAGANHYYPGQPVWMSTDEICRRGVYFGP
jgi:hypothetical protein